MIRPGWLCAKASDIHSLDLTDHCADVVAAMDWVARALGRRLTTRDKLRRAAARRAQLRWRADLARVLSPDLAGIHSALEFRYYRDVERPHRLPRSERQAPASIGSQIRLPRCAV